MPQTKQLPCCARKTSRLNINKAELGRLARRAARAPENPVWRERIAAAKHQVKMAEQAIVDHEAEHADHAFEPSYTGMVCDVMVMRDGGGDQCGLPASTHRSA